MFGGFAYGQADGIKSGVNIQASYYNNGHVNLGWDLMQSYPEIEALRIEIEPYRVQQAVRWISEAHEKGYQVIATYHDSANLGSDEKTELENAANWWKQNYGLLSESGPIIINIMNEWGSHEISPKDYADAYNDAITTIRSVYDGTLIVDVPGWGQAVKIAADAYPLFVDQDIIFSLHIYTSAFNIEAQRWLTIDDLSYLDATGAECIVGEFCDTPTGGADWCTIIDHCFANGWPLFGWAWNGDGRSMNMIEPHWRDEPLAETFRPTEFMDKVIDKLAGVKCFTKPDERCETNNLIGQRCDDDNEYTVNDRYNEYCNCIGTFTEELQSNLSTPEIIVYPNPVSSNDELTIELFKINASGQFNIYNSLGQTIISQTLRPNQDKILVNSSQLANGLYWASFQSDKEVIATEAFIVN